jgi:hypothetical protein
MKITLDGAPRYTSADDTKQYGSNARDHEIWFRVHVDGTSDEFFYLRASPRIPQERMQKILDRIIQEATSLVE